MQSFEFVDLFLFLGISQGVFLAITLQLIKNNNKAANKVLSVILLLAVLMLLGRMIFFKYLTWQLFQWSVLIDIVIFLFGPLTYMYFRRLVFSNSDKYMLPWPHYIPVGIHILFSFYSLSFTPNVFGDKLMAGFFRTPFFVFEVMGIASNIYYCIANFRLLTSYIKEEKNRVSYKQSLVSFIKFFQISVSIFLFVWLFSFAAIKIFDYSIPWINYNTVWGTISIFIYVVGYYSLKEPDLFRLPYTGKKTPPKKRLSQHQIEALKKGLHDSLEEEKMFLKTNLTLRDLSERLETSTHNISWYLNTIENSNFYDYINQYRVKEFVRKVENKEHLQHTILALSLEAGFNSKSTFNKAFKLEMDDTPRNYIKTQSTSLKELV